MPRRSLIEQLDEAVQAVLDRPIGTPPEAPLPRVDARIAPLLRIAAELRDLPREQFKARLKDELQGNKTDLQEKRRTTMATTAEPIAAVRTFAAPRLAFKNASKAIEFYEKAFGAKETLRFEGEFGFAHGEILIGDSVIMLAEEWPEGGRYSAETWGHSPISLEVSVPDVDAFIEHAVSAGAKLTRPIRDEFYGYRTGTVLDPFGYTWSVYTVKEELSVEEMHRRMQAMMPQAEQKPKVDPVPKGYRTVTTYLVAQDADKLIDFVKKTFNAVENFRSIGSAGGYHCEVRVGDSMLMIGGGGPGLAWRGNPIPSAFHIYVPDCDATYARALEAGGTSIDKPVDQF
ncbi:MAG: VOC family protein, partial [bacterium]